MDRNAHVWSLDPGKDTWRPTLVALRFAKSATCISWSPNGQKFAAGSADGTIAIGYYEADNDWWVCKHLKQPALEHTVTALEWHPDGVDLFYSTFDGKVGITSAYVKSVDER
jgi:actin related protein 2/3 complex subunit 1A/1B